MRENFTRRFLLKKAGQAQKRKLNTVFSWTSLSRSTPGTSLGQQRDKDRFKRPVFKPTTRLDHSTVRQILTVTNDSSERFAAFLSLLSEYCTQLNEPQD